MKKLFALMLALAMITVSCAAFAQTTLTVWCWDPAFNLYAMQEAAKVYETINPDVKIDIVEVSSDDCEARQTTALMSGETGTLPDIVLMQDNSGQKFLSTYEGSYFDMTDYINYDDFASYKVEHFTRDGRHYAVPFDNGAAALFVRTDYLEAAGYTLEDVQNITWDEFIEIGLKVKEATGNYMLTLQTGYADFVMMMAQSAGTWFFDADGNPNIAGNPVFEEIVSTIKKIHDSGIAYEAVDWNEYIASFNNGSAGSTVQGCWIIGSIVLSEDQSGKWGMVPIPRLNCEGATNYSNQGGSSWVIPASSPNAEAAVDFLAKTFAGSVDLYQTILPSSGAIATYLPAAGGEAYGIEHPFFGNQKVYEDLMEYAANIPIVKYGMYNYEARDAVVTAVQEVFDGGDVAAALATAQETVEFLMF